MDIIIKKRTWVVGLVCVIGYLAYCVWDPSFSFLYESGVGKKAIVVGATAGMGRETARRLMQDGYTVGCVGRRQSRLDELKKEFGDHCVTRSVDISTDAALDQLRDLVADMGGCDLMMICISNTAYAFRNEGLYPDRIARDKGIFAVDILGFWRAATVAREQFEKQKSGHLIGVSSTSGLGDGAGKNVYAASNAFIQSYLRGVRNYMVQHSLPIYVTDIVPGFVDVEYEEPGTCPGEYWSADVHTAGQQIFDAIKARKKVAFITKRWRLIAWLYKIVPNVLYSWVGGF